MKLKKGFLRCAVGVLLAGCASEPPPGSAGVPDHADQLYREASSTLTAARSFADNAPLAGSGAICFETATRVYRRTSYDVPSGTSTSTLTCDGDVWVARVAFDMRTSPSAGLMHELEEVRFRSADLGILSSRHRQWQGPMEIEVELARLADVLSGTIRFPPEVFGEQELDIQLSDGTLLRGMEEYLFATADLHEGWAVTRPLIRVLPDRDEFLIATDELRRALREERPPESSAFDVTIGGVAALTYRVNGTERVTVPAGTFSAFRVEVTGEPQPRIILVQRERPHIVLREEVPDLRLNIELEEARSP